METKLKQLKTNLKHKNERLENVEIKVYNKKNWKFEGWKVGYM